MEMNRKVVELSIDDVLPNRFQPRIKFSEDAITELSNSIKEHGVIQPIVVRPIGDKFEIIAGERRYKATCMAGLQTIPAIITDLNDKDSAEVALIENVQRENLTPIEEAISYKKILDMGYITQEALATKLGKTQSTIANKLRLLNLDDEVQEALLKEKISERHARSLLKLTDKEIQKQMLRKIISERMPVRKADEEIDRIINGEKIMEENNNLETFNEQPEIIEPTQEQEEILEEVPQDVERPTFKFINFQQPRENNIEPVQEENENEEIKPGKFFNILNQEEPQESSQEQNIENNNIRFDNLFVNQTNTAKNTLENELNEIEQSINNSTRIESPRIPIDEIDQPEETDDFENDFESEDEENNYNQITDEYPIPQPAIINEPKYLNQKIISFKDVLNSVRECSKEIEKSGYEIETEEYDLEGMYQVVFKIKKED